MVLDASGALSRGKGCISIPSPSAVRRGAEEGWPCLVGEQLWRPTSHDGLFAHVPTATHAAGRAWSCPACHRPLPACPCAHTPVPPQSGHGTCAELCAGLRLSWACLQPV